MVEATPGDGKISHTVEYVGPDGVVVNNGRAGSVYQRPHGLELIAGDKVMIGTDLQIHMARNIEVER